MQRDSGLAGKARQRIWRELTPAITMMTLLKKTSGNPGMAKGGMGDVLTGVLLALASNGMDTLNVALTGVYAHGLSGDIAADTSGERGVCAGDVARGMGGAWKILENSKKWIKK